MRREREAIAPDRESRVTERLVAECLVVPRPRDFPDRLIADFFGSEDEDGWMLPVHDFTALMRRLVGIGRSSSAVSRTALESAIRIGEVAVDSTAGYLTAPERARLLHEYGSALSACAYDTRPLNVKLANRAVAAFSEASALFGDAHMNVSYRRHTFFRRGALLADLGRDVEAIQLLTDALNGTEMQARPGLYFACGKQLMRMAWEKPQLAADIRDKVRGIEPWLLGAWSRRRWLITGAEPLLENVEPIRVDEIDWTGIGIGVVSIPSEFRDVLVDPTDRFAICTLLLWIGQPPQREQPIRAEWRLLGKLPSLNGRFEFMGEAIPTQNAFVSAAVERQSSARVTALRSVLESGRLRETCQVGTTLLSADDLAPEERCDIALVTATAARRGVSASLGTEVIQAALDRTAALAPAQPELQCALVLEQARNVRHEQRDRRALDLFSDAIDLAALTGWKEKIVEALSLRALTLDELGVQTGEREAANAFMLGASLFWELPAAFVDFQVRSYAGEKPWQPEPDTGDSPYIGRQLRNKIAQSRYVGPQLAKSLLGASDYEDRVALAECWILAMSRGYRPTLACSAVLHALLTDLARLGSERLCQRLCATIIQRGTQDKQLTARAQRGALLLRRRRLARLEKASLRYRVGQELRRHLERALDAKILPNDRRIVRWLQQIKPLAMDAPEGDDEDAPAERTARGSPTTLKIGALKRFLASNNAAIVEFHISSRSESRMFVLSVDGIEVLPLQMSPSSLGKDLNILTGLFADAQASGRGRQNPLTSLAHLAAHGDSPDLQDVLRSVDGMMGRLGQALWPAWLLERLQRFDLVYVSPDLGLLHLPILAMPTAAGVPFIEMQPAAVIPRSSFLTSPATIERASPSAFLLASKQPDVAEHSAAIERALGIPNSWGEAMDTVEICRRIRAHRVAYLFGHGYTDDQDPQFNRFALPHGGKLTSFSVRSSAVSFNGCEIHLHSCFSGHTRVNRSRQSQGLASAFLDGGAEAIIASLWRVDAEVSAHYLAAYHNRRKEGFNRAQAHRDAWLAVRAAAPGHTPFQKWLNAAPLVLVGHA